MFCRWHKGRFAIPTFRSAAIQNTVYISGGPRSGNNASMNCGVIARPNTNPVLEICEYLDRIFVVFNVICILG